MQTRVHSQGFPASMSHLWNRLYFHTSHKKPDILIGGTTHQVPFVAKRDIWLVRRLYGLNSLLSKHKKEEKQTTGLTMKAPETEVTPST